VSPTEPTEHTAQPLTLGRRALLRRALLGAGGVGLRALATGLPLSWLLHGPKAVYAQTPACPTAPQFLILSASQDGDPITCNVPGTYVAGAAHSAHPEMAVTPISLGGVTHDAARPWTALPQWVLDRTCFFHHSTLTVDHSDHPKVMRLQGGTLDGEMIGSIYAQALAPCLQTIQTPPLSLGARGGGELLSFQGRTLAGLTPTSLKAVLAPPEGALGQLVALRDRELDAFNAALKAHGNSAQRTLLDDFALSQQQVRAISDSLVQRLSAIDGDDARNQLQAALTLVQMKVAPVLTVHIPFGGDNHSDTANDGEVFANERQQHVSGMAALAGFFDQLQTLGLAEQVTFASYNVFGRSLKQDQDGRSHSFTHNCAILVGRGVRAGVIGGVQPTDDGVDFRAADIDSVSGAALTGGDVAYRDTMTSMAKTLGTALGVARETLDERILGGKVVEAALG